jgi:hypothetical protein
VEWWLGTLLGPEGIPGAASLSPIVIGGVGVVGVVLWLLLAWAV